MHTIAEENEDPYAHIEENMIGGSESLHNTDASSSSSNTTDASSSSNRNTLPAKKTSQISTIVYDTIKEISIDASQFMELIIRISTLLFPARKSSVLDLSLSEKFTYILKGMCTYIRVYICICIYTAFSYAHDHTFIHTRMYT